VTAAGADAPADSKRGPLVNEAVRRRSAGSYRVERAVSWLTVARRGTTFDVHCHLT